MSKILPIFGAALTYAQQQLGGLLTENESFPSVSTTPLLVAANNGDRVGLVLMNLGSANIFVGLSNGVGSSSGILLAPNGGNLTLNVRDDFTLCAREWDAICPTGGPAVLYVLELIRIVSPGIPQS